jgi:predicted metal-dependent hydrolase
MTTKWASYSTTGRLTFDSLLLGLRGELQDYVIVHEILRFHAPNHGKLWKSRVEMPPEVSGDSFQEKARI